MNISHFNKCSNCGACYNVCPVSAISLVEDDLFYTPSVDEEKCIECELCVKVCPVNNDFNGYNPISALAGWHKDNSVLMSSSSGGVFHGLAENTIANEGVVFGAAYSNDYKEVHFTSSDRCDLLKLQKSKYVESKISDIFISVKNELDRNRKVLFCGTPCQVAGLKKYLQKDYENLLTCDFVCGGLPSHNLYKQYLIDLEKKYNSKVKNVDFRPKTHGWKRYAILVEFENGKRYNVLGVEDPFLRSFLYGKYTVRDYCLECKFSDNHLSDITIADFWMHKKLSNLENEKGISLVVCNTGKGISATENLQKKYYFEDIAIEEALYNYKKIETSEIQKNNHDMFLKIAVEKGQTVAYNNYFKDTFRIKLKNRLARIIFRK